MKRFFINMLLVTGLLAVSSCEFDELLNSPNDVTLESSDLNFLLNRIQINFNGFYEGTSGRGQRVTRILHQGGDTYEISYTAVSQNGTWSTAYANILNDIKTLKDLAEQSGFKRHLAIAQTIEAYVLMALVDTFGDVPFSEALDPTNFNPGTDGGESVYSAAFNLLTQAKSNFTDAGSIGDPNDFFYGRNYTKWVRLVNTLQLRYHLNRRLIDAGGATSAINALVSEGNLLKTGDDFYWRYGVSTSDPDSRHPDYAGQFPNGGGDYQSVFFMWHLTEAKGFDDPRAKYYFYRQVGANPTLESEVRCITEFTPAHYPLDMVWCMPGTRGYWGRDHLDPQGIPPDGLKRTLYGIYPAGASFDNDTPASISTANPGNKGAGIQPIMLAAYVDFMLAEVALELNNDPAAAKTALLAGIEKHVNFVRSWSLTTAEAAKIRTFEADADFDNKRMQYLDYVGTELDAAADDQSRLRIIAREYWIALYGNGNEAYNLYRRTGQPDGMQPGQVPTFGSFPRTFFYPADHVNLNAKASQKAGHGVQVFWDNNPAGFID